LRGLATEERQVRVPETRERGVYPLLELKVQKEKKPWVKKKKLKRDTRGKLQPKKKPLLPPLLKEKLGCQQCKSIIVGLHGIRKTTVVVTLSFKVGYAAWPRWELQSVQRQD